jgi:hypothetical protein
VVGVFQLPIAKKALEMVKKNFKRESIEGKEYFFRVHASFKNENTQTSFAVATL